MMTAAVVEIVTAAVFGFVLFQFPGLVLPWLMVIGPRHLTLEIELVAVAHCLW
jgi:hypothetical protein